MTIAPKIAMSESFLTALAQVPKPIQKKVREFTTKFRANPTSAAINYEALHGMRDPKVRTVRIDQQYRAVVVHPPSGELYLLVWVDNHDEALEYALRHGSKHRGQRRGGQQHEDQREATKQQGAPLLSRDAPRARGQPR